jgi:hypothetical protein
MPTRWKRVQNRVYMPGLTSNHRPSVVSIVQGLVENVRDGIMNDLRL